MFVLILFCDNRSTVCKNWDKRSLFVLFRHEFRGYTVGNRRFPDSANVSPGQLHFQQYNHDTRAGTIQTVYVHPLNIGYLYGLKLR